MTEASRNSDSVAEFDHFIPVSTATLLEHIGQMPLSAQQLNVIQLLRQILAYRFHRKLVKLKKAYQPFNPDRELLLDGKQPTDATPCIEQVRQLLIAANYQELNQQQIQYALQKTSPYGLEIRIDFDAFSDVLLFYRGKQQNTVQLRDWKTLFLKKKSVHIIRYQRLFLLLGYSDPEKPGIYLKLFKDILRPDLEMLFPECKVRMKAWDKIKLAVTGGGGTAGGLFATIGKITAAVSPWTILIAVGGFAMLIWRQVSKIFIQKTRYMATLAQNLYFHNLDNNAGAITYLVDLARQEEIKEAILAYALLNSQAIDDQQQLDDACEQWFLQHFDTQIDFDVSDALDKLHEIGLIQKESDSLRCEDPEQSIHKLEQLWLSYLELDPAASANS
jgi:hypothetical protein